MQSIKQVAVFNASMAEGRVRSPLEAAVDSPLSPEWPSPRTIHYFQHSSPYRKLIKVKIMIFNCKIYKY